MNKMIAHELTIKCAEMIEGYFSKIDLGCATCKTSCCNTCAYNGAWFNEQNEKVLVRANPLFDRNKGFLGKTGCKLPRHQRSTLCNSFTCNSNTNDYRKSKEYRVVFYLSNFITELNSYINFNTKLTMNPTDMINAFYKYGIYANYELGISEKNLYPIEVHARKRNLVGFLSDYIVIIDGVLICGDLKKYINRMKKNTLERHKININRKQKAIKNYKLEIESCKRIIKANKESLVSEKEKFKKYKSINDNTPISELIELCTKYC